MMNEYEKLGRGVVGFMIGFIGIYVLSSIIFTLCEAAIGGGMTAVGNVVLSAGIGVVGGLVGGLVRYGN